MGSSVVTLLACTCVFRQFMYSACLQLRFQTPHLQGLLASVSSSIYRLQCLPASVFPSMSFTGLACKCIFKHIVWLLQDFSEAADALGSLNLSEGWSNLSLRSRHSESGAQDLELRNTRGDYAEASSSGREDLFDRDDHNDHLVSAALVSLPWFHVTPQTVLDNRWCHDVKRRHHTSCWALGSLRCRFVVCVITMALGRVTCASVDWSCHEDAKVVCIE